ncbi:hypothetical protein GCM10017554_29070 [Acinetobacter modestus]|nr:hypothetical protein GCM10017554_29070 [Acinetobacter modestus]
MYRGKCNIMYSLSTPEFVLPIKNPEDGEKLRFNISMVELYKDNGLFTHAEFLTPSKKELGCWSTIN